MFKENELILYKNGDTYQVGMIKRLCDDGAFVWYHSGDTASKTSYQNMFKISNSYCITETTFGTGVEDNPNVYYVSLVRGLVGNYVKFVAESEGQVRTHLDKYYGRLWCSVYTPYEMETNKRKFEGTKVINERNPVVLFDADWE